MSLLKYIRTECCAQRSRLSEMFSWFKQQFIYYTILWFILIILKLIQFHYFPEAWANKTAKCWTRTQNQ